MAATATRFRGGGGRGGGDHGGEGRRGGSLCGGGVAVAFRGRSGGGDRGGCLTDVQKYPGLNYPI